MKFRWVGGWVSGWKIKTYTISAQSEFWLELSLAMKFRWVGGWVGGWKIKTYTILAQSEFRLGLNLAIKSDIISHLFQILHIFKHILHISTSLISHTLSCLKGKKLVSHRLRIMFKRTLFIGVLFVLYIHSLHTKKKKELKIFSLYQKNDEFSCIDLIYLIYNLVL